MKRRKAKGLNARERRELKVFQIKPEHQKLVIYTNIKYTIIDRVSFFVPVFVLSSDNQLCPVDYILFTILRCVVLPSLVTILPVNYPIQQSLSVSCFKWKTVCLFLRYNLFLPLHELWKQYIRDLCNGLKAERWWKHVYMYTLGMAFRFFRDNWINTDSYMCTASFQQSPDYSAEVSESWSPWGSINRWEAHFKPLRQTEFRLAVTFYGYFKLLSCTTFRFCVSAFKHYPEFKFRTFKLRKVLNLKSQ